MIKGAGRRLILIGGWRRAVLKRGEKTSQEVIVMVSSGVAVTAIVFATIVTIGGGLWQLMSLSRENDSRK